MYLAVAIPIIGEHLRQIWGALCRYHIWHDRRSHRRYAWRAVFLLIPERSQTSQLYLFAARRMVFKHRTLEILDDIGLAVFAQLYSHFVDRQALLTETAISMPVRPEFIRNKILRIKEFVNLIASNCFISNRYYSATERRWIRRCRYNG